MCPHYRPTKLITLGHSNLSATQHHIFPDADMFNPPAMSSSKADVMMRLGLSGSYGEQVYKMMLVSIDPTTLANIYLLVIQKEAAKGRDRVSNDYNNLTDHSQRDATIQAPYKWDELKETAKHKEILYIAEYAGPSTRPYFQMGRYRTNVEEENWVAQWFLWHCFRYRDNRPKAAAGGGGSNNHGGEPSVD